MVYTRTYENANSKFTGGGAGGVVVWSTQKTDHVTSGYWIIL